MVHRLLVDINEYRKHPIRVTLVRQSHKSEVHSFPATYNAANGGTIKFKTPELKISDDIDASEADFDLFVSVDGLSSNADTSSGTIKVKDEGRL
jgi:hypothetical protein